MLLRRHLPRAGSVFLALDNVPDDSDMPWLKSLLESLHENSRVVVTCRSAGSLGKMWWAGRTWSSCMPVPTLEKVEAINLLMQIAVPSRESSSFSPKEMKALEFCVQQCYFTEEELQTSYTQSNSQRYHYHPLALRALGSYFNGIDSCQPLQWVKKSKMAEKLRNSHKHSIFNVLRSGYDALPRPCDKLLFLDVAIFAPREKLNNRKDLCVWLEGVYGVDKEEILYMLRTLQTNSLLEDLGSQKYAKVRMHDLYKEFAEYELQQQETQRWCVYNMGATSLPHCLESPPLGKCWPDLVRVKLRSKQPIIFAVDKLQEWAGLVVLSIDCFQMEDLDIGPLKCLRSLHLVSDTLQCLKGADKIQQLHFVNLKCNNLLIGSSLASCSRLQELKMITGDQPPPMITGLSEFRLASSLIFLELSGRSCDFQEVLNAQNLCCLQELIIIGNSPFRYWKFDISGLNFLTKLRILVLNGLPIRGSLLGLENLTSLEHLALNGCSELISLPDMSALTKLRMLDISTTQVTVLHGVDKMLQLRGLFCIDCKNLQMLPNLCALTKLKEVFVQGCISLSVQPSVTESCKLVTIYSEAQVLSEVRNFLENFGKWSIGESTYDEVLKSCQRPQFSLEDIIPTDLHEIGKAFLEVYDKLFERARYCKEQEFLPPDKEICAKLVILVTDANTDHPDFRAVRKALSPYFMSSLIYVRKPGCTGSNYTPAGSSYKESSASAEN